MDTLRFINAINDCVDAKEMAHVMLDFMASPEGLNCPWGPVGLANTYASYLRSHRRTEVFEAEETLYPTNELRGKALGEFK